MSCDACRNVIEEEESMQCTINGCKKQYHLLCAGFVNPGTESWMCPKCSCAAKKGGDNSLTPVGSHKKSRDTNITFRKKVSSHIGVVQQNRNNDDNLRDDIRSLKQEMSSLRQLLENSVAIIRVNETKIEKYMNQIDSLHNKLSEYKSENALITAELKFYAAKVEKLSTGVNPINSSQTTVLSQQKDQINSSVITVRDQRGEVSSAKVLPTAGNLKSMRRPTIPNDDLRPKLAPSPPTMSEKPECVAAPKLVVNNDETKKSHASSAAPSQGEAQWIEAKRKNRRPTSICGTAGPAVTSLKAVEPRKYLHLWNMESNAEEIRAYLRQLCPIGTCTVEELNSKGDYKSYKIGVPLAYYDACFSVNVWPVNARVKVWITFKKSERQRESPERNQSFRNHPKA